jgi:RNA-directed DNA polymerase
MEDVFGPGADVEEPDLVVLCHTRQRAEQARERVATILAPLGLHLHPDKTRIVSLAPEVVPPSPAARG